MYGARYDIDITVVHKAGRLLVRADALSRLHTDDRYRQWVESDTRLRQAQRVRVPERYYTLENEL